MESIDGRESRELEEAPAVTHSSAPIHVDVVRPLPKAGPPRLVLCAPLLLLNNRLPAIGVRRACPRPIRWLGRLGIGLRMLVGLNVSAVHDDTAVAVPLRSNRSGPPPI